MLVEPGFQSICEKDAVCISLALSSLSQWERIARDKYLKLVDGIVTETKYLSPDIDDEIIIEAGEIVATDLCPEGRKAFLRSETLFKMYMGAKYDC